MARGKRKLPKKPRSRPTPAWWPSGRWAWVYVLSLPVSIAWLLHPALDWGTNADDGYLHYVWGLKGWAEVLANVLVPKAQKVFLFGTDRPIVFLYYKIAHAFGLSPVAQAWVNWLGSWFANLAFAWGVVSLARVAFPVSTQAIWAMAAMIWWVPSYLISTATIFPDCWFLMGAIGAAWGLLYSELDRLPERLRPLPVRAALAAFLSLLACQTQEAGWVMLGWSSLWLLAAWLVKKRGSPAWALAPAGFAILQAVVYRSLSPSHANRGEFVISFAPASLWHVAQYYLVMGLNAVNDQVLPALSLNPQKMGVASMPHPGALVLTASGIALAVWRTERTAKNARDRALSWVILLGGAACTLPYLIISDRQLIYYALRLNAFLAAFVAIRFGMEGKKGSGKGLFDLKQAGAAAFLAGAIAAGGAAVSGPNWLQQFGGYAKDLHARVLALPGVKECTGESPCCLDLPDRGWNNNEWVVSWLEGAPKRPPFVWPGMGIECARTLPHP